MADSTVAASFVTGLLDYAVLRGARRDALLAAAALTPAQIERPEQRVAFDVYLVLIRAAKRLLGDPAFALHFGEAVDIREMSIVALLQQSSEVPGEAFATMNRYGRLDADIDSGGEDRFRMVRKGGSIWFVDGRSDPNASIEVTESSFARIVSGIRRMGLEMPLRQLHVTHERPPHAEEYERIFAVPIRFDAEWNAMQIDMSALSPNLVPQPALAARILAARADALLEDLDGSRSFRGAVEAALRPLIPAGTARSKTVAAALGVSRQTLYRRLRAEGCSYDEVHDALRRKMAEYALANGKATVAEIAGNLGFADHSSFTKAVRRWTGKTPGQLRKRPG